MAILRTGKHGGHIMPSTHHGILLHVIFSTKQRFALLHESWRPDLYSIMGGIARDHKATLIRAGGVEDHAHLLLKTHPSYAIAETIQRIKANSSNWINNQGKVDAKFSWQRGYGAFSVSQSVVEAVQQYIENQIEHHRKLTFREEYLATLRKHNIEFDQQFVFDDEIVA